MVCAHTMLDALGYVPVPRSVQEVSALCINNMHDKCFVIINCWKRIEFIRTDAFPIFTKHRVAGQPSNIPLMYNLILWNNFHIKNTNYKCLSFTEFVLADSETDLVTGKFYFRFFFLKVGYTLNDTNYKGLGPSTKTKASKWLLLYSTDITILEIFKGFKAEGVSPFYSWGTRLVVRPSPWRRIKNQQYLVFINSALLFSTIRRSDPAPIKLQCERFLETKVISIVFIF